MHRLPPSQFPPWLSPLLPEGIDRYSLDVGGRKMAVMEVGSGRPVLCVHGNPTWGFLYRKVMTELLGEPVRLIAPDLIGLGFSDRIGAAEHTLENHGRWLAKLIELLDLDDLVFVGQDWGGPIGLLAMTHHPGALSGMVILNTVVGPPRQNFKPTAFHKFARMPIASDLAFRVLGFPQIALHTAQGDRSSIRGQVARAYRFPLRGLRRNQAPLALARMVPDSHDHPSITPLRACQELFETFEGPGRIVWGNRDPVLGSAIRWLRKLRPDIPVTETRAGHFLQEEVPRDIAIAIRLVVGELQGN